MTVFHLINPQACVEIGRTDFLAAELAERATHRASAAAERIQAQRELQDAEVAFIASREPQHDADREEARIQLDRAQGLADIVIAAARQAEHEFRPLERDKLATAEPVFADILAEAFADRLSPELARVMLASFKLGVAQ